MKLAEATLLRILDLKHIGKTACIKATAWKLCVANLRAFFAAHEVLQQDVARRCGLSPVTFSYVMTGRRRISLDRMVAIGSQVGISPVDDLWLSRDEFHRKYCR